MGCDDKQLAEKVAEGVAKALEEKKKQDAYNEWAKQFPKTTTTEITEGYGWRVGDWLVAQGVVYEITGGVREVTELIYRNYYSSVHTWDQNTYLQQAFKLKLKTIPCKGQEAVEGWIGIDQTTPSHIILNRTLPGLELKKEP